MSFSPLTCMRRTFVLILAAWASGQTMAQTVQPFRLGVAPHTSARVILEMYQPLRLHLEQALGKPVEVVTAPDFTEFARRMMHLDYDLAITTGHQARLAQTDAGYTPLITYIADFRAVTLVAGDSKVKQISDLKGKQVLGLSSTSLVTLWGQHWLKSNGLSQPLRYISASDSVAHLILENQAAAGFASLANYQSLPRELQSKLRFWPSASRWLDVCTCSTHNNWHSKAHSTVPCRILRKATRAKATLSNTSLMVIACSNPKNWKPWTPLQLKCVKP